MPPRKRHKASKPVRSPSAASPSELLPPLLFPGATRTDRRRHAELVAGGVFKQIGARLHVRADIRDVAATVRTSWAQVVSTLFPDSLISHRTALEYRPSEKGEVFLTAKSNRVVSYPGLRLVFKRGPGPLDDDPRFMGIRASSIARALLENLSVSRGVDKNIPLEALERRLEQILRDVGEDEINSIRDRAREIATELEWHRELERLESLIGALLGTREARHVASDVGRARALGEPFDERCVERLEALFAELRGRRLVGQPDARGFGEHFRNKAFFEAYFSNYIEGTTFELHEAEQIVFDGKVPPHRPVDAHDISSTFEIVSSPSEMRRTHRSFDELRALLQARHAKLMEQRPELEPGQFKRTINRAGSTVFVHPDYVIGTLRRGYDLYRDLEPGLQRAAMLMFLVADVHPFNDGNGRVARIMMNAELVGSGMATIIIPTVYRDEYIDTLRALTRQHRAAPVVDMLARAQRFSNLDFSDYPSIAKKLVADNWFQEPGTFELIFDLARRST